MTQPGMTDGAISTPTNGVVTPPVSSTPEGATTAPVTAAPETPAVATAETVATPDTRDYQAELGSKDAEIAQLRGQLDAVQGTNQAATAEREQLMLRTAELLTEREGIAKELAAAAESRSQAIETLSKATHTVADAKTELEQKLAAAQAQIADYESKLAAERGVNMRHKVITEEFPHLAMFADYIPASEDIEAVRAEAKKFAAKTDSLVTGLRAAVATGVTAMPSVGSVVRTEAPGSNDLQARLDAARAKGPDAFEAALAEAIQAYGKQG